MINTFAVRTLIGLGITGTVITTTVLNIPKSKDHYYKDSGGCWRSSKNSEYKDCIKENSGEAYTQPNLAIPVK